VGPLRIVVLVLAAFTLRPILPVLAQDMDRPEPQPGTIMGTVIDVNNDSVAGASVVLEAATPEVHHTATTTDNGYFEFHEVKPGASYHITIRARGFAEWTSSLITLGPGEFKILTDTKLRIAAAKTTVDVSYTPEEIATQQVKAEEKQRIFGLIPNFYVVYDPNPASLTTKLKFRVAFKVSIDPLTAAGIVVLSAIDQAGDTPDYPQGWKGFGQRVAANGADAFTSIMIGGAIRPSLLHQDPRFFYQGMGTTKSRAEHALMSLFVCKGDNGRWQPNYSSLGGDLASSAISNTYYPDSNRGTGLVFENFALSTAERMVSSVIQEFLLRRLTRTASNQK
jgi:carboxypeptidase family protein